MLITPSKTGLTPAEIKEDYWLGTIQFLVDRATISDTLIANKIRGQEDQIERELGILWRETRIRSEPDPGDTDFDLIEAPYDYTSDFFVGEAWGYLRLRRSPVRSVQRIVFAYPNIDSKTFTVPAKWIRLDSDFGYLRLVPDGLAIMSSFSGYVLSILSGGRGIPQTINVDYTAGFSSGVQTAANALAADYQDLKEHLKLSVIVDVLRLTFLPGSSSTSADGLSDSMSLDIQSIIDQQQAERKMLKARIKGIIMTVV